VEGTTLLDLGRPPDSAAPGSTGIATPRARSTCRCQSAGARGMLVLNRYRSAHCAGSRYAPPKSDKVWMRNVAIRDVHVEIVAWIARSGPRLKGATRHRRRVSGRSAPRRSRHRRGLDNPPSTWQLIASSSFPQTLGESRYLPLVRAVPCGSSGLAAVSIFASSA
jgi:hypothetical protein